MEYQSPLEHIYVSKQWAVGHRRKLDKVEENMALRVVFRLGLATN